MQIKVLASLSALFLLAACMELGAPYSDSLRNLSITAEYPTGFSARSGAAVTIESVSGDSVYKLLTDASGKTQTFLPDGIYRISIHDRDGLSVFNATMDKVIRSGQDLSET